MNSNISEIVLTTDKYQFYVLKSQTACYLTLTMFTFLYSDHISDTNTLERKIIFSKKDIH